MTYQLSDMISVVVPNFNGGERLVKNLPRLFELLKNSGLKHEVIVVDDASTDNSVGIVGTAFARGGLANGFDTARVIRNDRNMGFGMTVDRGIREAKGEVVFVLNAIDMLPESADYFKIMLTHFGLKKNHSLEKKDSSKASNVFSVGALKKDEEDHGCGRVYFEKGFFLHNKWDYSNTGGGPSTHFALRRAQGSLAQDKPTSKVVSYSAWADGGSQALRKEYYLKIGGFDPLYKFYWEDVDLGYRAWKAGYEIHFEPKAVLIHQKSEGPIAKYYSQRQRRIMNLRNQMIFLWKNADWKHLFLGLVWWLYHVAVAIKNGDGDFFVAHFQAKLEFFGILGARWRQKETEKLSDDAVLAKFAADN